MRLLGSMMNCSRKDPIFLLSMSMERSLKFGSPSTCTPSPHMRNWFPRMKDPDTLMATPSRPWARHWSFSTTWTSFSRGQSPANVLRISDSFPKISIGPENCFPEKLKTKEVYEFLAQISWKLEIKMHFSQRQRHW